MGSSPPDSTTPTVPPLDRDDFEWNSDDYDDGVVGGGGFDFGGPSAAFFERDLPFATESGGGGRGIGDGGPNGLDDGPLVDSSDAPDDYDDYEGYRGGFDMGRSAAPAASRGVPEKSSSAETKRDGRDVGDTDTVPGAAPGKEAADATAKAPRGRGGEASSLSQSQSQSRHHPRRQPRWRHIGPRPPSGGSATPQSAASSAATSAPKSSPPSPSSSSSSSLRGVDEAGGGEDRTEAEAEVACGRRGPRLGDGKRWR